MAQLLNKDNYYTPEANQEYMSVSQYKDFMTCEAMALAKIRGEWEQTTTKECLVGSYIHAWSEGAIEQFILDHPEMFTKQGTLKAEFKQADLMIETLANDPLCMMALSGQKEVTMTAMLFDTPWKIRMDVYNPDGKRRIVDIKSARNINELVWSSARGAKVSFIDAFNYPLQYAVYSEVERINLKALDWAETYMVAVSKEDPPDKAVISMVDDNRFIHELYEVQENMPRILEVKSGKSKPNPCGRCAYCRSVKKLSKVVHYSEIGL